MKNKGKKIVFTGSGIVCGSGSSPDLVWEEIKNKKSSIRDYKQWDNSNWDIKIASEVTEKPKVLVTDRKLHKTISRSDMFGIYVAKKALEQSKLINYRNSLSEKDRINFNDRSGIIVGSGGCLMSSHYDYYPLINESKDNLHTFGKELSSFVTPMWILKNLPNNVLCHVGIQSQFKGTNACITNHSVSALMAISESANAIINNESDRIISISHDSQINPEMVHYYNKLGLLSKDKLSPFSDQSNGTVFGEGAGAVILEKEEDAIKSDSKILGEFLGSGFYNESSGITEINTNGIGVSKSIEIALDQANLSPNDIGMICAHGNGNSKSDFTEAIGIKKIFGDNIPPVTSFKWAYGHSIAASGIMDLIMTLNCLNNKTITGCYDSYNISPDLDFLPLQKDPANLEKSTALIISRGFGGLNTAIIIKS